MLHLPLRKLLHSKKWLEIQGQQMMGENPSRAGTYCPGSNCEWNKHWNEKVISTSHTLTHTGILGSWSLSI